MKNSVALVALRDADLMRFRVLVFMIGGHRANSRRDIIDKLQGFLKALHQAKWPLKIHAS